MHEKAVILLAGEENTLSIARSLGKKGIKIHIIAPNTCTALWSRYCTSKTVIPLGTNADQVFSECLIKHPIYPGSIIFACSDAAILFMAHHRQALSQTYILDFHQPEQQLALLDKQKTLELAAQVDIPFPQFWKIKHSSELDPIQDQIMFPVLIKPLHTFLFAEHFGVKLFRVDDFPTLKKQVTEVLALDFDIMVCEHIPGPDTQLSSYYTHMDAEQQELFKFTKQVLRRYPENFGGACYHQTKWLPETAKMGQKFFKGIKFSGLGNIEFKYDTRDQQLKLIEINARFTAAQELLVAAGIDIAYLTYCRLTKTPTSPITTYKEHLRLWIPFNDIKALIAMRRENKLTIFSWLISIWRPQVTPYFKWQDLMPWVRRVSLDIHGLWAKFTN